MACIILDLCTSFTAKPRFPSRPQITYVKRTDLQHLLSEWGDTGAVLSVLRKLVQVSSRMTFAVRAPSFNDEELTDLLLTARDVVIYIYAMVGYNPQYWIIRRRL